MGSGVGLGFRVEGLSIRLLCRLHRVASKVWFLVGNGVPLGVSLKGPPRVL